MNTVATDLAAARSLIESPEQWCQNALRVGKRLCAYGALRMATLGSADVGARAKATREQIDRMDEARDALYDIVRSHGFDHIEQANDRSAHRDVLAMFDEAIETARGAS